MNPNDFVAKTLERPGVRSAVDYSVRTSLLNSIPVIDGERPPEPNWRFALLCASAMTDLLESEAAQQAILRIAQGCLISPVSTDVEREGAESLLRRMGNSRAIGLAKSRGLLAADDAVRVPLDLQWEIAAKEQSFSIDFGDGQSFLANPFQRRFWEAAENSSWVSVSAPTSSGKSFILRKWVERKIAGANPCRVVFLTPTRALVEETGTAFRESLPSDVPVITLPWDAEVLKNDKELYVLTQERLHLIQQFKSGFSFDFLVVDEAQKVGDDSRGIILSEVIDEAVSRNPLLHVVFASPMASNPEILLEGRPGNTSAQALIDGTCTVNQTLLYVNQVPRNTRSYEVRIANGGKSYAAGKVHLSNRPTTLAMKFALIALSMGEDSTGNLIYANGRASAEKMASLISHYRPKQELDAFTKQRINDAVSYVSAAIHPKFALCTTLRKGSAFHYGSMPLHVKELVEGLFKDGIVKYLTCTSTLLEGVNLPCTNIFVRAPKKGDQKMNEADFWNLAGRAGRWGNEFQGNVVCIDTEKGGWGAVPTARTRQIIQRAADLTDVGVTDLESFVDWTISEPSRPADAVEETLLSFLSSRSMANRTPSEIFGVRTSDALADRAQQAVARALTDVNVPRFVIARHAGISPTRIQALVDFFRNQNDLESFVLPTPESDDAYEAYKSALDLVAVTLGGPCGNDGRRFALLRLIVRWMKGVPMSRIIDDRYAYRNSQGTADWSSVIRDVMKDVEDFCRFHAPKYLACYADALEVAAGRPMGEQSAEAVTMMLELGVPRTTDMSLIGLGLSRATTIAIGELQRDGELDRAAVQDWIVSVDWETAPVARYAAQEVLRLLEGFDTQQGSAAAGD